MDTRLSIRTLGLSTGDAHIIRDAGGIVTEDTVRSLVVSHYRASRVLFCLHGLDVVRQIYNADADQLRIRSSD